MSISEIIIIMLVVLLIIKPADVPIILKKIRAIKSYFSSFRNKTISYIIDNNEGQELNEDIEQLNFFLQKVVSMDGQYDGDYTLEKVKHKYKALVESNIRSSLRETLQKKETNE